MRAAAAEERWEADKGRAALEVAGMLASMAPTAPAVVAAE